MSDNTQISDASAFDQKPLEGDCLVCVGCNGVPARPVLTFYNTGEDYTKHYQKVVAHACRVCNGTGKISLAVARRYHAGRQHRNDRVARGESFFAAAQRLGIRSAQLSAYEHGFDDLPGRSDRKESE